MENCYNAPVLEHLISIGQAVAKRLQSQWSLGNPSEYQRRVHRSYSRQQGGMLITLPMTMCCLKVVDCHQQTRMHLRDAWPCSR